MIKKIVAVAFVCFLLIQYGVMPVAAEAGLPVLKAESASYYI